MNAVQRKLRNFIRLTKSVSVNFCASCETCSRLIGEITFNAGIRASGGNSFGRNFVVTTFGESHGGGVGCIVDGVPPNLPLTEADIQVELDRR